MNIANYKVLLMFTFLCSSTAIATQFNTDLLNSTEKGNVDFSRFSDSDYVLPGNYLLNIYVNGKEISKSQDIKIIDSQSELDRICLDSKQLALIGLKNEVYEHIIAASNSECKSVTSVAGSGIKVDLSTGSLLITIPKSQLEFQDDNWRPPSAWEDGLPGVILDYNINTNVTWPDEGHQNQSASIYGVLGGNAGPWRMRGDYQGSYYHSTGVKNPSQIQFDWTRFYAYRAIKNIASKLLIGESNITSDIFDSWRYFGVSLSSDEQQLPPALRGYAPEVTGIAKTNAKVTISQQGRVLYETVVPSGPFQIRDLKNSVGGDLDVEVQEQDGSVQRYQVVASSLPYLTRPGSLRYNFTVGRPEYDTHSLQGPVFSMGDMSYGLTGQTSLYGGAIFSNDYNSVAAGIGQNLDVVGTISGSIVRAKSVLPGREDTGQAYKVSYYKGFPDINGQLTVASYRFASDKYHTMQEFLDYSYDKNAYQNEKEQYVLSFNQSFNEQKLSFYLNWNHKTYWNRKNNDSYSVILNKYFDYEKFKNIMISVSAVRNSYQGYHDDVIYTNITIPFGNGNVGFASSLSKNATSTVASTYQTRENGDSYRIQVGERNGDGEHAKGQANGFYVHNSPMADINANMGWLQNSYMSAGLSISGGLTATSRGAALHPSGRMGGTRMLIDTDGVGQVPVGRSGETNAFGYAVQPGVIQYSKARTDIDVNRLPEDIEVMGSPVTESFLTEGAIGYRKFNVIQGLKVAATVRRRNGNPVPFGSSILDNKTRELTMVGDSGFAWIPGVQANGKLGVSWNGKVQCYITLPPLIDTSRNLLLPCD